MKYIKAACCDQFYCAGANCPAPCAAPVDMTWTKTLGDVCEAGLSMACPRAAEQMLMAPEKAGFSRESDSQPPAAHPGVTKEQLDMMLDARKTVDLLLQDRELPLRSRMVLALTYCAELEPMIAANDRFGYGELDWGFTEQPYRQFQVLTPLTGTWELKRSDMCNLLYEISRLCAGDTVLENHLEETQKLFHAVSGEEFRKIRERFDRYMEPREYLFENMLVYDVHRYFLADTSHQSVELAAKRMAVRFAVIRAMAARVWQETGALTDELVTALCWHLARCIEQDPDIRAELDSRLRQRPLYEWERLQRLLWQ